MMLDASETGRVVATNLNLTQIVIAPRKPITATLTVRARVCGEPGRNGDVEGSEEQRNTKMNVHRFVRVRIMASNFYRTGLAACVPGNVLGRARAYQIQSVADFYYPYKLVLRCLFFRSNWNCKLNVNDFVVAAAYFLPPNPSPSLPSVVLPWRAVCHFCAGIADQNSNKLAAQQHKCTALARNVCLSFE